MRIRNRELRRRRHRKEKTLKAAIKEAKTAGKRSRRSHVEKPVIDTTSTMPVTESSVTVSEKPKKAAKRSTAKKETEGESKPKTTRKKPSKKEDTNE